MEKSQDEANLKTGRTGRVFQGFAVLGAELPAVKNLGDLAEFLGSAPLQLSAIPDDTDTTARKIVASGLPDALAKRIVQGA